MAAGLHLNHKASWSDLKDLVTHYKDPGIELPIGPCGCIHITKKKVEIQVSNRKYLSDKICDSPDCEVTGSKIFRKSEKQTNGLNKTSPYIFPYFCSDSELVHNKKIIHFVRCFNKAVQEFADTERSKIVRVVNQNPDRKVFINGVVRMIKEKYPELESIKNMDYSYDPLCTLFPILIEAGEAKTLLEFNNDEISSVFDCSHTQAIGKNWSFLYTYHIFTVYIHTNLIVSLQLEKNPDGWGCMKPGSYYRRELMHDCSGQTMLDSCRKYLKDDVYMKDMDAMKKLCKDLFKFIYITEMVYKEVTGSSYLENHAPWEGYLELSD